MDIPKIPGAKEYATLKAAQDALAALGGKGVIIAVQSHVKDWTSQPGSGNFATFFGTYWEWVNHANPGMLIKHGPNLPGGFQFVVYFVVPHN